MQVNNVNVTVNTSSGFTSPEISGVETDLSDVISVQQPAEESLQS